MSSLTVLQTCEEACRELGVGALGEPIEPEYVSACQLRLNIVIDAWKAQRLMIWQVLRRELALTASTASYTIGPSGVWNVQRPSAIVRAGFVNNSNPDMPLELPVRVLTDEEWAAVGTKSTTSTIVDRIWYQTSYDTNAQTPAFGLGKVYVNPIMTTSGTLALYLPVSLDEVADDDTALTTTLLVPPGYRRALVTSLAVESADALGVTPSDNLMRKWTLAMKVVKKANIKAMTLRLPGALMRRSRHYNLLTGE